MSPFDLSGIRDKNSKLEEKLKSEELWSNPKEAQGILREKKQLEKLISSYEDLEKSLKDIEELIDIVEEMEDEAEAEKLARDYESLKSDLESLLIETLLDGKYDRGDAILTLHSGAGGVDAQDWTQMLLRMYTRWCEKRGYDIKIVDYDDDTEAGIKAATIMVSGENAYGYLKNERGVHRLVRISPFNAAGKRQTSFASVEVMPKLDEEIKVDIDPKDLKIDTYRSSGAGGQHVNTTDSAIRITHIPTNIVVTCQNERSQMQNREVAMRILIGKLVELAEREHKENLKELAGDYSQITWGSQIRSYVLQPYKLVKDHRTKAENTNVGAVLDGDLDYFIREKLKER